MNKGKKYDCDDDVPIGGYFDHSKCYCPNCGNLNVGLPDNKGAYKSVCQCCGVMMRRKHISRTKDTIEIVISRL